MWAQDSLFRQFTHTEPVLLKYGKLATKYPSIYGYFFTVQVIIRK